VDPALKLARVPRRPPRVDFVIAGALLAWALLEAFVAEGPHSTVTRVAFSIGITAPLVFRRQAPLAAILVIAATALPFVLTADVAEEGTMPFPCILVAIFSVALYARRESEAIAGLVIMAITIGLAITSDYYEGEPTPTNYAILFFFTGGAWTAGWLVRRRAAQVREALEHSGELAAGAVAEERARIARELHDVVAHSVSIVAVQAGAAEEWLDSDPERAREHLASVRRTAREAMTEMRRLLDVLRTDDTAYAPQPGLSRLPELLDETRAAGLPVELVEEGERPELSPGLDLVAFRIVQESLTNVRKHAGEVPTRVLLRYRGDELELEVTNEPSAAPSTIDGGDKGLDGGHGLVGMRERVRLYGGRLETGENGDGGFRVHALLPLSAELR
jgi:signal transduction histidine kinase